MLALLYPTVHTVGHIQSKQGLSHGTSKPQTQNGGLGTVVAGARGAAYCERRDKSVIYPTVHTVGHIQSKQDLSHGTSKPQTQNGGLGTVVAGARGAAYCERHRNPAIYPTVHTVGHIQSKQHPSQGELPVPLLMQSATMPGVVNGEAGAYRHLRASVECSTRRRFGRHDFPTVALRIPHPPPTMSVGVCTRDQGAAQCRIISNSVAPYQRRELNGGAKVESISSDECV